MTINLGRSLSAPRARMNEEKRAVLNSLVFEFSVQRTQHRRPAKGTQGGCMYQAVSIRAQNAGTGQTGKSPQLKLPQDPSEVLYFCGNEIWLFNPSLSLYKAFTTNEAAMERLRKKAGVMGGAIYSRNGRVKGRDYIIRLSDMDGILNLLRKVAIPEERCRK